MARVSKVKQYLDMSASEFSKLKEKELRKVVQTLADAGNKRIKRMNEAGLKSPALNYIEHSKGGAHFSPKGKKLNQLRAEYIREKNFLTAETGNIKGARKFIKDSVQGFYEKSGIKISEKDFQDIMEIYEDIKRADPSVTSYKYHFIESVSAEYENGATNAEDIKTRLFNRREEIYKEKVERENSDDSISNFFFIDNDEEGDI